MPLALRERPAHAPVEGLDSRVENAASRVEVAGSKCVWISRQAGAGERQVFGAAKRRRATGISCGSRGS